MEMSLSIGIGRYVHVMHTQIRMAGTYYAIAVGEVQIFWRIYMTLDTSRGHLKRSNSIRD